MVFTTTRRTRTHTNIYSYSLAVWALNSVLVALLLLFILYPAATRLQPRRHLPRPNKDNHLHPDQALTPDHDVNPPGRQPEVHPAEEATLTNNLLLHLTQQRPVLRSEAQSISSSRSDSESSNIGTLRAFKGLWKTVYMLSSLPHQGKRSGSDTLEGLAPAEETQKTSPGDVSKPAETEPPRNFDADKDCWVFGLCVDYIPLPVDGKSLGSVLRTAPTQDAQMITPGGASLNSRRFPEMQDYHQRCHDLEPNDPAYQKCLKRKRAIQRTIDILLVIIVTGAAISLALGIVHLCSKYRRIQERSRLAAPNVNPMRQLRDNYRSPPVVFSPSPSIGPRTVKWHNLPHRAGRPIRDEELGEEEDERTRYMACSIDGTNDEGIFRRIFKKRDTALTSVQLPPAYAPRIPSLQLPNPELSVRLTSRTRRFSSGDVSLIGKRRARHSVVGWTIPEEPDVLNLPNSGRLRPAVGDRRSTC